MFQIQIVLIVLFVLVLVPLILLVILKNERVLAFMEQKRVALLNQNTFNEAQAKQQLISSALQRAREAENEELEPLELK